MSIYFSFNLSFSKDVNWFTFSFSFSKDVDLLLILVLDLVKMLIYF